MANTKENNYKLGIRIIIFIFLLLVLGVSFFFRAQIEVFINGKPAVLSREINEDGLIVHFIDVGQGDSIAIKFPDGKKLLIDAGPRSSKTKLVEYLDNRFFGKDEQRHFDYLILTHQDEDHIGGAPEVFAVFQINVVYMPKVYTSEEADKLGITNRNQICTTSIFATTVNAIASEPECNKIYSEANLQITGSDYSLKFLTPGYETYNNANNYSPVLLLEYSGKKLMFTGDAEKAVEDEILEKYNHNFLDVDVLKVGHHGSKTSSTNSFLKVVKPEISFISCGADNKYGHPDAEVIDRLKLYSQKIYRTDINGNMVLGLFEGNFSALLGVSGGEDGIYISYYYLLGGALILISIIVFVPHKTLKKITKSN